MTCREGNQLKRQTGRDSAQRISHQVQSAAGSVTPTTVGEAELLWPGLKGQVPHLSRALHPPVAVIAGGS